jgi:hypothetical protein
MRKFFQLPLFSLGLLAVVLTASGCIAVLVGAAAGAGGYAWVNGVLVKQFDQPVEDLYKATQTGIEELGLVTTEKQGDRLTAFVRAQFSDGNKVKVTINALTELRCEVRVRVGVFGNQTRSEMVLSKIEKNL